MGLPGISAVQAMQQTLKANKALLRQKKSLKEISKDHAADGNRHLQFASMTPQQMAAFKTQLQAKRKRENRAKLLIVGGLALIGILAISWIVFGMPF